MIYFCFQMTSGVAALASTGSRPIPQCFTDLLECSVCQENYRNPKALSCLHTFCTNCLERIPRIYSREISCPVCKKITLLSLQGVKGLPNDFRVQQMRDIYQVIIFARKPSIVFLINQEITQKIVQ